MTPNVSCRSAVKATAVARSMVTAIRGGRPSPPESLRLLVQITDSGCFNRLRARPRLAGNEHLAFGANWLLRGHYRCLLFGQEREHKNACHHPIPAIRVPQPGHRDGCGIYAPPAYYGWRCGDSC